MTAARLQRPRYSACESATLPEPGPTQLRVHLEGCGVCASSLPLWQGRDWFSYPLEAGAPGHEGWGVVDAVGDDVTKFSPGDRVAVLSQHAFAEYDVADEAATVRLPRELDATAFPGEALGCAMNVFRRSAIKPKQTVAIIGAGFIGALLVQLAAGTGANVLAVSRRRFAQDVASQCGAAQACGFDEAEAMIGQTAPGGCPVVIEATGQQAALDLAGTIIGEGGRMVIAGYHQDGLRQINMQQWNWRGIDVINAHERDLTVQVRGMQEAVQAVIDGRLDPSPLLTHRFPLDQVDAAFELIEQRPDGFVKALVVNS